MAASQSQERAALAKAIEQLAASEVRLGARIELIESLRKRLAAARAAVEAAQSAINNVEEGNVAHLADPMAPKPALTVKEAKAAVEDAEQFAADLNVALGRAKEPEPGMRTDVNVFDLRVKRAIGDVIRADPASAAICAEYLTALEHAADLRGAVAQVWSLGALPPGAANILLKRVEDFTTSGVVTAAWKGAIEALRADASTALPSPPSPELKAEAA